MSTEDFEQKLLNWLGSSMSSIKILRDDTLKLLNEIRKLKVGFGEALCQNKISKIGNKVSELQGRYIECDTKTWKLNIKTTTPKEEQELGRFYTANIGGLYRELDGCLSFLKYVVDTLSTKHNRADFLRGLLISIIAILISSCSLVLNIFGIF